MLPFALYLAFNLGGRIVDGYKRRDGTVEHLTTAELRHCIDGRKALTIQTAALLKTVGALDPRDGSGCTTRKKCITALREIHDEIEQDMLGECDGFNPNNRMIEDWAANYGLCGVCKREMLEREAVAERRRMWRLLAGMFGLTVEACGFTTDNE